MGHKASTDNAADLLRNVDHMFFGRWYTTGRTYGLQDDEWKMIGAPTQEGGSVLVSSGRLPRDMSSWFEVPQCSALMSTNGSGREMMRMTFLGV